VEAMLGMTLSGKYWYEEFKDELVSVGFTICPIFPVMFTRKEEDNTPTRIIVYIDGCLYFSTSDTARDKFQKQVVDRLNVKLQGLAYWYLSDRTYQDKEFNVTMDQSRYAKSILTKCLEAGGMKKSKMPHISILRTNFVNLQVSRHNA
jgi:tRNA(His) 5'-end guanylyltransferase